MAHDDDPNAIRILLTTDNHVGYKENDPIIGDDSWKTFHEITSLAKELNVDMMVQGGDLFHVNKPLKKSMYHVIKSLRINCMGDRPCELELLSDPSGVFDNGLDTVNYEDPNLNVSIPVFAVSGNHDDASGVGLLLPLDVLSVSGYVNHFGKVVNNEGITVSPVLLQKGTAKLALYGMGNVRDERLSRTFRDGNVRFLRPNVYTEEWFNLFVIHQNHVPHGKTAHIPETFLPLFLDFVYWGHEHECMPIPQQNPETGFDVLQAGSSVATSLSEGEVPDKHVFILTIKEKNYTIEPIKLKTVRPFVMKDVILSKSNLLPGEASRTDVIEYLVNETEQLIDQANQKYIDSNKELFDQIEPDKYSEYVPLPLVRMRVDYSGGYEFENAVRFSNRFVNRIANANDVVTFLKKRDAPIAPIKMQLSAFDSYVEPEKEVIADGPPEVVLQELIDLFLSQTELVILPENGLHNAVDKFLDQSDKHMLELYVKEEVKNGTKSLINYEPDGGFSTLEVLAKSRFERILEKLKVERETMGIGTNKSENAQPKEIEKSESNRPKRRTRKKVEVVASSEEEEDAQLPDDFDDDDSEDEYVVENDGEHDDNDNDDDMDSDRSNEVVSDSEEERPPKRGARAKREPKTKPKTQSTAKSKAQPKPKPKPKPKAQPKASGSASRARTSNSRAKKDTAKKDTTNDNNSNGNKKKGGKSALLNSILSI